MIDQSFSYHTFNRKQRLSLSTWNVNGLIDRILGDKFKNVDFINHLNKFDCLVLTETWSHKPIQIANFKCFCSTQNLSVNSNTNSNNVKREISGGILIFFRNNLVAQVTLQKSTTNFVWCKVDKELMGTETYVFLCGAYIPPINSKYCNLDFLKNWKTISPNLVR